ncbi:unnamed protein product, partial [Heterotrigona itama]
MHAYMYFEFLHKYNIILCLLFNIALIFPTFCLHLQSDCSEEFKRLLIALASLTLTLIICIINNMHNYNICSVCNKFPHLQTIFY